MKRLLYFIAALCLVACEPNTPNNPEEQDPDTINKSQFVGVWAVSSNNDDEEAVSIRWYIQFNEDGTWEILSTNVSDVKYYVCENGTYSIKDSTITLVYKNLRGYFYKNNIPRIACSYATKDLYPGSSDDPTQSYDIVEISKDKISTTVFDTPYYFYYMSEKPTIWDARFFESEKEVTEEALIAQWDHVNYFTQTAERYSWWYYDNPEEQGIQLLADEKVGPFNFWSSLLWNKLVTEGIISSEQGISMYQYDCSWSLRDKTVSLTCAKYRIYNYVDGNWEPGEEVVPESPISADLTVHSFRESFLILHCDWNDTYYVFTPGSASAKSAEKHVRYVPAKATKIAKEPGHMLLKDINISSFTGRKVK